MIDSKEASEALSDIDEMVRRVRQSRTYELASLIMILWGVLVFAGNVATWLWPWQGYQIWISVDVVGILGTLATGAFTYPRTGVRTFNVQMLVAYLLFLAFGYFCSTVLGHFTPRQQGTFWPVYFMLFYSIAGLWFGYAFIAIGICITVLTLIGYFYIGGLAFLLWMAFVNGGGLILGGLWMRRI
ncbi:MAG: hypothetical protein ABI192_20360 [Bradyrhizobium sp.]